MNEWIYLAYVSDNIRAIAFIIFLINLVFGIYFIALMLINAAEEEYIRPIKIVIAILIISGAIMTFLPSSEMIQTMTITEIPAKPNTEYAVNK